MPNPAPADPPKPPRIKSLTLRNFRAFPGPTEVPFEVNGKNVVLFGENGSGKSSIFHALDGMFSVADKDNGARKKRLKNAANLFSEEKAKTTSVSITFDNGITESWTKDGHPCDVDWQTGPNEDSLVLAAAYRKAILDYRSLLETNFRHTSGAINLFDVCVHTALRDYRTAYDGSEISIKELWGKLAYWIDPPKSRYRNRPTTEIPQLGVAFSQGIRGALDALIPTINKMLKDLSWEDVEIERFNFSGVTYNDEWQCRHRDFKGKIIEPVLKFKGKTLEQPHLFLNEARLSALALAIYFAGRELCAKTNLVNVPKIMVLDDVVIGLDRSNRLPLVDLLAKYFTDWQVFLLTHDRGWYDMIRSYHRRHNADKYWSYWELQENDNIKIPPVLLQASSSAPKQAIDLAKTFLAAGHVNAAGNAARIAVERAVREFCEVRNVPVPYKQEIEKVPFSQLLSSAKKWDSGKKKEGEEESTFTEALKELELCSKTLNPLSHGGTTDFTRHEVKGTILLIDAVLRALKVTSKFEK